MGTAARAFFASLGAILLIAACAESPESELRAGLGRGETVDGNVQDATSVVSCVATPQENPVASGESFPVSVTFIGASPPVAVAGFTSGVTTGSATITGRITNFSSTAVQETRRIRIIAANGIGSCLFTVTVDPN